MIPEKLKVKKILKNRKALDSWLNQRKYVYLQTLNYGVCKHRLNNNTFQVYNEIANAWVQTFPLLNRELESGRVYGLE